MSLWTAVNPLIHPSQNDVNGGITGSGKIVLEKYLRELFRAGERVNYVISGGQLPTSGGSLTIIVPGGVAYIDGYYVVWQATNVTLPGSSTSKIYVRVIFSGDLASGIQIEDRVDATVPQNSLCLGTVTTSGSAVTAGTDLRVLDGGTKFRSIKFSGTGSPDTWTVPPSVTKIRIRQWGAGGGGGSGGGGSGSANGGDGSNGGHGGYIEAIVNVTPGDIITMSHGVGGSGGSGSSSAGNNGSAGGNSSVSGTGFSFTNPGGPGGRRGGAAAGAVPGPTGVYQPDWNIPSASVGTLDVAQSGLGAQGGKGSDGTLSGSSTAALAGRNAFTIIDY